MQPIQTLVIQFQVQTSQVENLENSDQATDSDSSVQPLLLYKHPPALEENTPVTYFGAVPLNLECS